MSPVLPPCKGCGWVHAPGTKCVEPPFAWAVPLGPRFEDVLPRVFVGENAERDARALAADYMDPLVRAIPLYRKVRSLSEVAAIYLAGFSAGGRILITAHEQADGRWSIGRARAFIDQFETALRAAIDQIETSAPPPDPAPDPA